MERKLIVCEIMNQIFERGFFLKEVNGSWRVVSMAESERKVFQVLKYLKGKRKSLRRLGMFLHRHNHRTGGLQSPACDHRPNEYFSPSTIPRRCNGRAMNGFDDGIPVGYLCEECCGWKGQSTLAPECGFAVARYEPSIVSDGSMVQHQKYKAYNLHGNSCCGFAERTTGPAMDAGAAIDYEADEYPLRISANGQAGGSYGAVPP
jgi:hypothetical protein